MRNRASADIARTNNQNILDHAIGREVLIERHASEFPWAGRWPFFGMNYVFGNGRLSISLAVTRCRPTLELKPEVESYLV